MTATRSLAEWRKTTERKPVVKDGGVRSVEPVYLRLGEIIREMRERRGISAATLADALNWTRANVSAIELGRQRVMLHSLPALAKALGIPVLDLLPPEWVKERR